MNTYNSTIKRLLPWLAALALLQGCASGPNANPNDPFEPFNRTIYNFNDGVDRAVLKPVATVYRDVTPRPIRTGVTNFFGNLSDVWSMVNSALQLKPEQTINTFFRVTTNTLWGVGGLFDVATDLRIEKHSEDFGKTLGRYGVGTGPYIVLPLLGPSNVRDTIGTLVDSQGDIVAQAHHVPVRNTGLVLRTVNGRANLLQAGEVLEEAALDKYSFTRDVYMQRRKNPGGTAAPKEERFDLPEAAPAKP